MRYIGYVKGDVVILKEPLAVPDGTEVQIFLPPAKDRKRRGRGKSSVAQATFGVIPSDPAVVHAVLEEDRYETLGPARWGTHLCRCQHPDLPLFWDIGGMSSVSPTV
jgi:hypothetical protein